MFKIIFKKFKFFLCPGLQCVTATATGLRYLLVGNLSTSRCLCRTGSPSGVTPSTTPLTTPRYRDRRGGTAGGGRGRPGDGRPFLAATSWINKKGTLRQDKQKLKLYRHRHLLRLLLDKESWCQQQRWPLQQQQQP